MLFENLMNVSNYKWVVLCIKEPVSCQNTRSVHIVASLLLPSVFARVENGTTMPLGIKAKLDSKQLVGNGH